MLQEHSREGSGLGKGCSAAVSLPGGKFWPHPPCMPSTLYPAPGDLELPLLCPLNSPCHKPMPPPLGLPLWSPPAQFQAFLSLTHSERQPPIYQDLPPHTLQPTPHLQPCAFSPTAPAHPHPCPLSWLCCPSRMPSPSSFTSQHPTHLLALPQIPPAPEILSGALARNNGPLS